MRLQSLTIDSEAIEMALYEGQDLDSAKEYLVFRLPLPTDVDLSVRSVNFACLSTLHRLQAVIDAEIRRLQRAVDHTV